MRNTNKTGLMIMAALLLTSGLFAQKKFGHINSNDLLMAMPERKDAEKAIQDEAKALEQQLQTMTAEYQTKVGEYQAQAATMTDIVKQTKATEIGDLEKRIQEFQSSAQESLQKKEGELLQPIIEKAKAAITEVSKKNGYAYVFDSSVGVLLHQPESDDILPLVKKQLGLE